MAGTSVCVYCRKQPANPRYRPFCSERCQLADLGQWLQGNYRVPASAAGLADSATIDGTETDIEDDDPP